MNVNTLALYANGVYQARTPNLSANAAVQRPRDHVSSAARVHNEVTHMRRARADVSRSAATACYATRGLTESNHAPMATLSIPSMTPKTS
jgi:hypothetical protein